MVEVYMISLRFLCKSFKLVPQDMTQNLTLKVPVSPVTLVAAPSGRFSHTSRGMPWSVRPRFCTTADGPISGSGPLQCLKHLVETEGWRGLARGTTGTLAREIPGNALFFTVYEVFCHCVIDLSRPWLSSVRHHATEPVIYKSLPSVAISPWVEELLWP